MSSVIAARRRSGSRLVLLERSYGFSRKELSTIMGVVEEHQQHLLEQWHGFFGG